MNLIFNFQEIKFESTLRAPRKKRGPYKRKGVPAALAKELLCLLALTGFLTAQQAEILVSLLGVGGHE